MKGFLFDENLPQRILFSPKLPIISISEAGSSPSDSEVWEFARKRELVVVSKDADFSDRIIIQQPPPWVVHLRFGNLRKKDFHALLSRIWPQVETLLRSHKLVNVYADRLEGIG
jgi:predicted nuclease of predicted toxin-antitoxin system